MQKEEVRKGDWIRIKQVVLSVRERDPHLPSSTRAVPLECYVNGWALFEGRVGDEVEIETLTGRRLQGVAVKVRPRYEHGFGEVVPELDHVGNLLRLVLAGRCSDRE